MMIDHRNDGLRTILVVTLSLILSVNFLQLSTMRSAGQLTESFEFGFGDWTPDWNYDPAYFSITISSLYAYNGLNSVSLMVHGLPSPPYPQVVGWIERTISIPPGATRDITVTFWLYSETPLDLPRNATAYIGNNDPEQFAHFTIVGQTEPPTGWKQFSHQSTVTAGPSGLIYVAVGVHNNLNLGPKTYYIDLVEITGISDDYTPPDITNLQPLNETMIGESAPLIGANYSDSSGIDTSSIILEVDGTNVTSSAYITTDGVEYTPPLPLSDGMHNVSLQVRDDCVNHNLATASWWFIIDSTPPTTTLLIGNPKSIAGGTTYFTSSTQFTLTADDGPGIGVGSTWYKVWSATSGWSTLTKYVSSFPISGSDGIRFIEYNSTDIYGNDEVPSNYSTISGLYLDNTGPVTTFTIGTPQYDTGIDLFVSSGTDFNLTSTDIAGVDEIWYRVDSGGTWNQYQGDFFLTGSSDGLHTVYHNATDVLGNTETPQSQELKIDNTPPQTTLMIGIPKSESGGITYFTSSSLFTFTHNNDGAGSGVKSTWYRIWNATSGWSGWINYSDTGSFAISGEDGTRYVEFYSIDMLDNQETLNNYTTISQLCLDESNPITTLMIGNPQYSSTNLYVSSSTGLSLTSISLSEIDTIWYRINLSGSWTQYTSDFTLIGEADGTHTVYYYAVDVLGNQETEKSRDMILDNTPPTSTMPGFDPLGKNYINNELTPFTINATDGNGSGLDEIRYGIDNMNCPNVYTTSFALGIVPEGHHYIYYKSIDNLGNEEAVKYIIIFLDLTDPNADAGKDKEIPAGTTIDLDGSKSDDGLTGSGIVNYTWTFEYEGETIILEGELVQFKFDLAGTYNATLTVKDAAGNTDSDEVKITVTGDDDNDDGEEEDVIFPWWILIVIALVIVIIILVLLLLRKNRKTEEEQEAPIEKESPKEEKGGEETEKTEGDEG